MSLALSSITLGAPLPDAILQQARRDARHASWSEHVGAQRREWSIALTEAGDAVHTITLWSQGPWEQLVADYDAIVRTLTERYGPPTSAPADEDAQRDVDLDPTGLPSDRYWHLRSREWLGSVRARVSLFKVWPGDIELKLGVEPRMSHV